MPERVTTPTGPEVSGYGYKSQLLVHWPLCRPPVIRPHLLPQGSNPRARAWLLTDNKNYQATGGVSKYDNRLQIIRRKGT